MDCKDCQFWNKTTKRCIDKQTWVDKNSEPCCRYASYVDYVESVKQIFYEYQNTFGAIFPNDYDIMAKEIVEIFKP